MTENDKELAKINLADLKKTNRKNKVMSIRTSEKVSKWMTEKDISPSKLFNEAARVLMQVKGET